MSTPTHGAHGQPTRVTRSASLLFWLLIVCGLAGVTAQKLDNLDEVLPLWLGTVSGVAIGQLVSALRVRAWVIAAVLIGAAWFTSVLFAAMPFFGTWLETLLLALVPAAICGYLSLSERGGLIAFWFPVVLWMLVILDGPGAGSFSARAAVPFLVGLGALFVAFLRARETRRAAIWNEHAVVRLAKPMQRKVLRRSPIRSASQLVWTGLVGTATLVMAAWIAPHLWQKDVSKHTAAAAAAAAPSTGAYGVQGAAPCCPAYDDEVTRTRVREYLPLLHGHDEHARASAPSPCTPCRERFADADDGSRGDGSYGGYGGGMSVDDGAGYAGYPYSPTPYGASPYSPTPTPYTPPTTYTPPPPPPPVTFTFTPPPPPPPVVTVKPKHPKHISPVVTNAPPVAPVPVVTPAPTVAPVAIAKAPPPQVTSPQPLEVFALPAPAAPGGGFDAPWKSVLALCIGGLGLHVLLRAGRRQLTLRHLRRPFWAETLDQRISNHWQRMLIGLRDAGIESDADEQPHALAERVAIEGMATCATILERVRHGVCVDANDLQAMDAATGAVYRTAREKAGISGRAAAWLRWPLA